VCFEAARQAAELVGQVANTGTDVPRSLSRNK